MTHSFRLRVRRAARSSGTLDVVGPTLRIPTAEGRGSVALTSPNQEKELKDSSEWILSGSGYPSADDAWQAGRHLRNVLLLAMARLRIGADDGRDIRQGGWGEDALSAIARTNGRPAVNDTLGLTVFSSLPQPTLIPAGWPDGPRLQAVMDARYFIQYCSDAMSIDFSSKDSQLQSLEIYHASCFLENDNARFLLLVTAIEALLSLKSRSESALRHADELIRATRESTLEESGKASILGALRWLKFESINQAGQRLANELLGGRRYGNFSSAEFFKRCYNARSRIAHGEVALSSREEIRRLISPLEMYVVDLITSALLSDLVR